MMLREKKKEDGQFIWRGSGGGKVVALIEVFRVGSMEKVGFEQRREGVEGVIEEIFGSRTFQEERTVKAKAIRHNVPAWRVQGASGRPVGLELGRAELMGLRSCEALEAMVRPSAFIE